MTFIGLFFVGIGQTQWCGKENYSDYQAERWESNGIT